MKVSDLKAKSIEDLQAELLASLKEQFSLRMQQGSGQPPKQHLFKRVRRQIAVIKTLLSQKGVFV